MTNVITSAALLGLVLSLAQFADGGRSKSEDCTTAEPQSTTFHSKLSSEPKSYYPAGSGSWIRVLNKASITMPAGAEIMMQFAELYAAPGDIREVHWHINSGEWAYIKSGTCEFTLMDSEGRFNTIRAVTGDVWYFPKGWQHSFQAVDPTNGCTTLIWFDKADFNIDLTHTIAELPRDIVRRSLKDIPRVQLQKMIYPLYDVASDSPVGVLKGEIPTSPTDTCKGKREYPCNLSLNEWPTFPMKGGERVEVPGAGIEYKVKKEQFPATKTMSGGIVELEAGALREIHWHPDSEEQHYVLNGKVRVTVYGVDRDLKQTLKETFEIGEGDLGIVPINYIHYIEAVDGPATLVVTFNSPSWQTQTLSQTFLTTPEHVTRATFNISQNVIDTYFPDDFVAFLPAN